jgi:hypothetical protein
VDSKIGRYGPSYFRGILRIPSKIVSKRFYSLLYRLSRVLKKSAENRFLRMFSDWRFPKESCQKRTSLVL